MLIFTNILTTIVRRFTEKRKRLRLRYTRICIQARFWSKLAFELVTAAKISVHSRTVRPISIGRRKERSLPLHPVRLSLFPNADPSMRLLALPVVSDD